MSLRLLFLSSEGVEQADGDKISVINVIMMLYTQEPSVRTVALKHLLVPPHQGFSTGPYDKNITPGYLRTCRLQKCVFIVDKNSIFNNEKLQNIRRVGPGGGKDVFFISKKKKIPFRL